jgi:hypothetical protein
MFLIINDLNGEKALINGFKEIPFMLSNFCLKPKAFLMADYYLYINRITI